MVGRAPHMTKTGFFTTQHIRRSSYTAVVTGPSAKVSLDGGTQRAVKTPSARSQRSSSNPEGAGFVSGDHREDMGNGTVDMAPRKKNGSTNQGGQAREHRAQQAYRVDRCGRAWQTWTSLAPQASRTGYSSVAKEVMEARTTKEITNESAHHRKRGRSHEARKDRTRSDEADSADERLEQPWSIASNSPASTTPRGLPGSPGFPTPRP